MWVAIAVGAAVVGVIFWASVRAIARREIDRSRPTTPNPEQERHRREYAEAMRDAAAAERERQDRA